MPCFWVALSVYEYLLGGAGRRGERGSRRGSARVDGGANVIKIVFSRFYDTGEGVQCNKNLKFCHFMIPTGHFNATKSHIFAVL